MQKRKRKKRKHRHKKKKIRPLKRKQMRKRKHTTSTQAGFLLTGIQSSVTHFSIPKSHVHHHVMCVLQGGKIIQKTCLTIESLLSLSALICVVFILRTRNRFVRSGRASLASGANVLLPFWLMCFLFCIFVVLFAFLFSLVCCLCFALPNHRRE